LCGHSLEGGWQAIQTLNFLPHVLVLFSIILVLRKFILWILICDEPSWWPNYGHLSCAMLKVNTKEEIKSNQSEGNAYQFVALSAQVALLKLHNKIQFVEIYLLLIITYLFIDVANFQVLRYIMCRASSVKTNVIRHCEIHEGKSNYCYVQTCWCLSSKHTCFEEGASSHYMKENNHIL
jgi:hypothetical protein